MEPSTQRPDQTVSRANPFHSPPGPPQARQTPISLPNKTHARITHQAKKRSFKLICEASYGAAVRHRPSRSVHLSVDGDGGMLIGCRQDEARPLPPPFLFISLYFFPFNSSFLSIPPILRRVCNALPRFPTPTPPVTKALFNAMAFATPPLSRIQSQ